MGNRIITIGREFGSNGRQIGLKLAERLGIPCYDKQLIELAAKHTDIPVDQLERVDEKKESRMRYLDEEDALLSRAYRYEHIDDVLFDLQAKVIQDLAQKEDCIFVGRCADYVLANEPRARNIFLYAPTQERIRNVMDRYPISEKEAHTLVKRMDKDRRFYYHSHTDKLWDDFESYDLTIDTGVFSIDEVVSILEAVYKTL